MNDRRGETSTSMERMLVAGKITIPGAARTVSGAAQSLHVASRSVDVQTALAGDPKGMRDTLEVCEELQAVLGRLTESLNNCATAVVDAAEDYAATDERAKRDLSRVEDELREFAVPTYFEVAEPGDLSAPGATQVSASDNSPTKTYETHIDSTPAPDHIPTVEENQRDRDERIDDVAPPEMESP